jgi:hypothetical protein
VEGWVHGVEEVGSAVLSPEGFRYEFSEGAEGGVAFGAGVDVAALDELDENFGHLINDRKSV